VLVVRGSGCESALDLSPHDCPLRFTVEHPPLGLSRPKPNHSAGHVLAGHVARVIDRLHGLRIVQRSDRVSQRIYRDAVMFPHRDSQLLTQSGTQILGWHSMIMAHLGL
jgi:hypothetical protein